MRTPGHGESSPAPLVSIVLPVYNGAAHLDATLESLASQSLSSFEMIVVDDASTDDSWQILAAWAHRDRRIRLHRHGENRGHRAASNTAFTLARGRYVARTDQDDLSLPERLATQTDYLEGHPAVGLLGSAYYRLEPDGRRLLRHPPTEHAEIRWRLLFDMTFPHSSLMFRRGVLGPRPYRFAPAAYDYEICARLASTTRIAAIATPLVVYRQHPEGMSKRQARAMELSAAAISARQIRPLLAPRHLERRELAALRRLASPSRARPEDLAFVPSLVELMRAFGGLPHVSRPATLRLRRRWLRRLVGALPRRQLVALFRSRELAGLWRGDAASVAACLVLELGRRTARPVVQTLR